MIEKILMNPTGMIWLIGVYSVICLLLLSRAIKVFAWRYEKITDEEILDILHSPFIPRVSLIVPDSCIPSVERVFSLMSLQYGNYELVLVMDKGNPLINELKKEFLLIEEKGKGSVIPVNYRCNLFRSERPGFRKLVVVIKEKDSLGDALNAGVNVSSGQYVCLMTRPGFLFRDSLIKLLKPFLENFGDLTASSAALRIRPVDSLTGPYALRTIRNFVLHGSGWSPVVTIEAFCEGIGMMSRKDILMAGGFSYEEKDPVRTILYKLVSEKIDKSKKPGLEYIPEVLLQADNSKGTTYSLKDQFNSYLNLNRKKTSFKRALLMMPVVFPGIPYFLLLSFMICLVLVGPGTGQVSLGGSIAYFIAGYTFLVASSLIALFIEIRYSMLRYTGKEIRKLISASFVLPFRFHFPGKA